MIRADVLRPGDVAVLQSVCLRAYQRVGPMLLIRTPCPLTEAAARKALRAEVAWHALYEMHRCTENKALNEALARLRDAALSEARRMGV